MTENKEQVLNFKKDPIYKASFKPSIINVPTMRLIAIDGAGLPDSSKRHALEFQNAIKSIFGLVYTIKFWSKKHVTPPGYQRFVSTLIEGLWWTQEGVAFERSAPKDWKWTLMLRVPDFVTPEFFDQVVQECLATKPLTTYDGIRLEDFTEGLSAQILHQGPYDEEAESLRTLLNFIQEQGYVLYGKHHELYIGDPRRSAPEKLRTILRHPIMAASA